MKNLFFLFGYACCLAIILPLLFSSLHLVYFAPFLVLALYRCPLNHALWWSLGCGLILDLYSSESRLGTYALNYCLTTFCLYGYKMHFFEDRFSTLPVMSFCYACLSNFIQACLLLAVGNSFHFSWEWLQSEMLSSPMQTSLYSMIGYRGPLSLLAQMKKRYSISR